jgi:flagellar L-ring protein precursor FlgH
MDLACLQVVAGILTGKGEVPMRIPASMLTLLRPGAILALALLSGCGSMPQKDPNAYAATLPPQRVQAAPTNGSIYQEAAGQALFEDLTARHVGDVLTIVLSEKTAASKKASTNTSKDSKLDTGIPTLLGRGVTVGGANILNSKFDSSQEFAGSGDSSQSNSLNGTVTVTVAEVLPNGNLFVRGQKLVAINQGEEFIQISGIVRPVDIRADNSVSSTLVADARIAYRGKGAVADSNAMGWLARFFNSQYWPF